MSKLSYKIQQALDEVDGTHKNRPLIVKVYLAVTYYIKDLWYDYPYVLWCNLLALIKNFKFFWPHMKNMRDFSYNYQITLFCDSLEYLAKGLKRANHCVSSEKNYRRCLFAARQLRNAYNEGGVSKSYQRLSEANPIKWVPLENGMVQMCHDYSPRGEEYYIKMFKLIVKKEAEISKARKQDAWDYLNKHIESFWD